MLPTLDCAPGYYRNWDGMARGLKMAHLILMTLAPASTSIESLEDGTGKLGNITTHLYHLVAGERGMSISRCRDASMLVIVLWASPCAYLVLPVSLRSRQERSG